MLSPYEKPCVACAVSRFGFAPDHGLEGRWVTRGVLREFLKDQREHGLRGRFTQASAEAHLSVAEVKLEGLLTFVEPVKVLASEQY